MESSINEYNFLKLIDRICITNDFARRKQMAKGYAGRFNQSYEKSSEYMFFLDKLAEKDILVASFAAGKDGRHCISKYLRIDDTKYFDSTFAISCLAMDFYDDLANYMKKIVASLDRDSVKNVIKEVREATDECMLMRFIRVLNKVDCNVDYIDDVFLDCPIDSNEFQLEEKRFCQELFQKKNYIVLFDYLSTTQKMNKIVEILQASNESIYENLYGNMNVGSVLILLAIEKNKDELSNLLIDKIHASDMDNDEKDLCIFMCAITSCIYLRDITDKVKDVFKSLRCSSDILMQYRKYVGYHEIQCFKKLLKKDKKLYELLEIMGENNTFSQQFQRKDEMRPYSDKNKKYVKDNKEFWDALEATSYSEEEKKNIRENTHMRLYRP